jgi:two-component system sensor histidine kinase BaeS
MIDVAHELRTPLTNIRGYLEALHDEILPPSRETFALLHEETMRLVQLVEDVLQLARADAARGHLHRETVDLGQAVQGVLETFAPRLAQKKVSLLVEGAAGTLAVPADPDRITRVLRNLMDNAARYAPAGGRVTVRLTSGGGQVRFDCANDAPELVPTDLPFLFERFYRGEKSRSREHGGAGIGLSIVKELVEAHGGKVGAELIGRQVHIWFSLPSAPSAEAAAPATTGH